MNRALELLLDNCGKRAPINHPLKGQPMQINLEAATPWPEINTMLKQARSITVIADGKRFAADADLSIDEQHNVTLTVGKAKKARK